MRCCTLVTLIVVMATPAFAQEPSASPSTKLIISDRAIAAALLTHPPAPPPPAQSRDSLKNGVLVGAVVGGLVMGGFVTWLCNELREPSDPSCLQSTLYATALGAGIGAAGGAGIDALVDRRPTAWPAPRPIRRTPRP